MEKSASKGRTPSRCREWERNRRNKFNDALSRLGDLVKEINNASESSSKESDNVQYPKIEIIEKAILCLTMCLQEKTQLKAEILALHVKIDTQKQSTKDASTQVLIRLNKRKHKSKFPNMVMLQNLKIDEKAVLKDNPVLSTNATVEPKMGKHKSTKKESSNNELSKKLPTLLPRTNFNNIKKGSENTIVVLPGTPYILPQRPFLFPTAPPTFVLVDPNMPALNKPSFPLVNRSSGDVTKTTMVNILPISAYSRPMSASKAKKSNKLKMEVPKKNVTRKSKQAIKNNKDPVDITSVPKDAINSAPLCVKDQNDKQANPVLIKINGNNEIVTDDVTVSNKADVVIDKKSNIPKKQTASTDTPATKAKETVEVTKVINQHKSTVTISESETLTVPNLTPVQKPNLNVELTDKQNKTISDKEILVTDKDKVNKLTNMLDTTLCENVVDGGNARLELAEEFLAASPTAAFLMSFPLVSGNRADSPAEEAQNTLQIETKDNSQRRHDVVAQTVPYFEKPTDIKTKSVGKSNPSNTVVNKQNEHEKYVNSNNSNRKPEEVKSSTITTNASNASTEYPFLNLQMPTLVPTTCSLGDTSFGLDFDCQLGKSVSNQPSSYPSNSNIFYKSDPFSNVKSTIYSTSSISSGHEFNSFGLYPCAMEKYTSKNKSDYHNVEDNIMKIGSSRLTYDIDLGWSHKGFEFVNSTNAPNTFTKDNILTPASSSYCTAYNPFNPDFHAPLVSNAGKKDSIKPSSSFAETITNFYSQSTNLWSDDTGFYNNNNIPKASSKHQNFHPIDNVQPKSNITKQYEVKHVPDAVIDSVIKPSLPAVGNQITEKYTKKSPSKMHINWMTSEIRPMENNFIPSHTDGKDSHKATYSQLNHIPKKHDHNESNYFPISMHNFTTQSNQEELQVWPSTRPAGTTEISMEPPPINLPTLVGDLALGPHDKKKNLDISSRGVPQQDIQNCSNFFSVTQLMNRSTDNHLPSRFPGPNVDTSKSIIKQNGSHTNNDQSRKTMPRLDNQVPQPCHVFNDSKTVNSYETVNQFSQSKPKLNKSEKVSKTQKNNYSAEALIRGASCTQKQPDNSAKFIMPSQKYNDYNTPQDTSIAQVSHFPPILDYSDNNYAGQQFSGTNLYNSTTNTISNSFYTNFMPGSSNLMSSNYTSGPFSTELVDYNQTPECNYTNHKYNDLKTRNNVPMYQHEKVPSTYKSSRRESTGKHKLECSKKDANKKYQSKRVKLNTEVEEWSDTSHLLWQNKTPAKRHSNLLPEELPFPNYVTNQMPAQYQSEFFNSHIMSSNVQSVGHNVDRAITAFPATSRANFNLSTIFPEITMKVQ